MKDKTFGIFFVILVLAGATARFGVTSSSDVVNLTVDPTPVTAKEGTQFTVGIRVENAPEGWWGVWGWQARFEYNASILTLDSAEEGPFLSDWATLYGASTMWYAIPGYCDEHELNYTVMYCSLMPGGTLQHGRNGSGTLAYVNFTVTGAGSSVLFYHGAGADTEAETWLAAQPSPYILDYIGSPDSGVTFVAVDGQYVKWILGDIDYDVDVDLCDLYLLSQDYGNSPPSNPECDLDGDNDVDTDDLDLFAGNYGETVP